MKQYLLLKKNTRHASRGFSRAGFTLIEILVAVAIFSLVMVSSTAALLTIISANAKAQSLKAVIDNLNVAVENISRSVRTGTQYSCNGNSTCTSGSTSFTFTPQESTTEIPVSTKYEFGLDPQTQKPAILRTQTISGITGPTIALTAPEVSIDLDPTYGSKFYLIGDGTSSGGASRLMIIIKGKAGLNNGSGSSFTIQTTVSQRARGGS